MAASRCLADDQRGFLTQACEIIFINPFSAQWYDTAHTMMPGVHVPTRGRKAFFKALAKGLHRHLEKLVSTTPSVLQDYDERDRELVKYAYLLQAFIACNDDFENLIQAQLAQDSPTEVPFASNVIHGLLRRGFSMTESVRYFALFYQIQRAYYFTTRLLVGESQSMRKLRLAIWNCVFTMDVRTYDKYLWNRMEDFSTLLLGETGTGKGPAAAAIGQSGFIPFNPKLNCFQHSPLESHTAVNLSQFPEGLIESELFGHCKGAFTGAVDNHKGLLERCHAFGTLFLDEIGDVSVPVQIKLLQVLQDRSFTPVGSHRLVRFRGRVIAATNQALCELREKGNFRDDFYYRLSSDVIPLPPLRQRIQESPAELELLVHLLIKRTTGHAGGALAQWVLECLQRDLPPAYPWPGNVRELAQAVRSIMLSGHYRGDARLACRDAPSEWQQAMVDGTLDIKALNRRYCTMLYQRHRSYEAVARVTKLDRRTVKKYLQE